MLCIVPLERGRVSEYMDWTTISTRHEVVGYHHTTNANRAICTDKPVVAREACRRISSEVQ